MMIKKLLFIALLLGTFAQLNAQTIVRGKVTDASNGKSLPGATVGEIDKNNRFITGTITDVDGRYSLEISNPEGRLNFSFMGYQTKIVEINGRSRINVELKPETKKIDQVEVVADKTSAGDGVKNIAVRDLSTSVETIEMKELDGLPTSSVADALQGQVSGVEISSTSGDPGAGMSIKIRGTTSLSANSQPLIVVDGVPYETSIGTDFNFQNADVADYGSLVDISPADIKSIQILKDAASTAVWGSRGANGVIVIKTKRGARRSMQFNLDYRNSYVFEPEPLPMLNGDQYVRLMLDEKFNRNPVGIYQVPVEYQNDPSYGEYHNYNNNTNWVDRVSRNGMTNNVNFAVSGGGEKARYRASVGYYNQKGTTIGTALQRMTARLNLDYNISDRLRFSVNFAYTNSLKDRNYYDGEWWNRDKQVRPLAYAKAPHMAVYEHNASGEKTGSFFNPELSQQGYGSEYPNPVALARDGINNDRKNRVLNTFKVKYDLVEGLTYHGNISFDITNNRNREFLPQTATGVPFGNTEMNRSQNKEDIQNIIQSFNKLLYEPDLGNKHELTMLGMFSTYDKYFSQMRASTGGIPSQYMPDPINDGISPNLQSYQGRVRTVSYLVNGHYIYDDRYIFSGGVRVDGDSRFGPNNRYGTFPSLSAGWRISSEPFMESLDWLNNLKLRVSYGENGASNLNSYAYLGKYQSATGYLGNGGIELGNVQLNNLKWETTRQTNLGLDVNLFNRRLSASFNYYDKLTSDIIFSNLEIPSTSGFASLTRNWGSMSNKGWELNIQTTPYKQGNWRVDFDMNFARNRNIIEEIPENYATERFAVENGEFAQRIQEGHPIGTFYGFNYLGVFSTPEDVVAHDAKGNVIIDPETNEPLGYRVNGDYVSAGDAIYEDINHDGNINELDLVYLGDANPDFFGGFGASVYFKNFYVRSYFYYKVGQDLINETRMYSENMYTTDNQSTAVLRRWRSNGDQTDIPRAVYQQSYNWLGSSRFVEDASFLRCKSVSIGGELDGSFVKKFGVKKMEVYLTAYNIFTLTNYTGQDPEVGFNGTDPFALGRDRSQTPPPVSMTFGVNMTF
jgi:TonB-linked SusC/RagA family outer membrane protein